MTSRLKFRNVDADPAEPVETWPIEGIQAALERGSLSDYRRVAAAIRRDPWGDVARQVEHVLAYTQPYGSTALMRHAIDRARTQEDTDARAEVATMLREAVAVSKMTQAAFARRLGTSPSRLSTYLRGEVTPSASILVRAQRLARSVHTAGAGVTQSPRGI
jgi:DNA-binding transcriptional regulator YiaG